jgi:hypothetical protein
MFGTRFEYGVAHLSARSVAEFTIRSNGSAVLRCGVFYATVDEHGLRYPCGGSHRSGSSKE